MYTQTLVEGGIYTKLVDLLYQKRGIATVKTKGKGASGKKVLIIVRDFLPYCHSLGGVIRVVKMAQFLQENGYETFVLCAKGEEISYFGYEGLLSNLNVIYVNDILQRYNNRSRNAIKKSKVITTTSKATIIQWLKNLINELCIPDIGVLFTNQYVKEASTLINKHGIVNVIVSSPPHSTQIIGLKLKRTFGSRINLIVDYRDSWNTCAIFQKNYTATKMISRSKESQVLKVTDEFLYVSRPMLEKINNELVNISSKSVMIMNGFDLKMVKHGYSVIQDNNILTIGYFGEISDNDGSFRDPTRFLEEIFRSGLKIKLIFYGPVILNPKWKECFGDRIEINNSVSHAEALDHMTKMDILLIVHSEFNGGEEVITGKIFDYFLALRPVLVVGPNNMEAARIVEENNLGYCIDIFNEDEMAIKIKEIYKQWQVRKLKSYSIDDVVNFSRQNQYSKLFDILK